MNLIKKLFKNKKGNSLIEKIMVTGFAVAAGGAVIAFTSNVIIEAKNKNISGILDGDGAGQVAGLIPENEGTEGLTYAAYSDGYKVTGYSGTSANVTIPSTHDGLPVRQINQAFWNCTILESVVIGQNVQELYNGCFYLCPNLKSVVLPEGLKYIRKQSFLNSVSLTSITIPDSVEFIGYQAFNESALTSIHLGSGLKTIDENAFFYCDDLTNVTLPSGVQTIGRYAFAWCKAMQTINIPSSVTSMGLGAFYQCENLTINCEAGEMPGGWNASWNNSNRPVNWGV